MIKINVIEIFSIISIIFLIFGVISAFNYEGVVIEKQKIIELNPYKVLINVTNNNLTLIVTIKNPSQFNLNMYAFTALIKQKNKTVCEIWRSYYFYTLNPTIIFSHSIKNLIYSQEINSSILKGNEFNVTLELSMVFSGFSYFYENPGQNFSPQRYYLTDMVMININVSENVD